MADKNPVLRLVDTSIEEIDVESCIEVIPDLLRKAIKASMKVSPFMRSAFFAELARVLYRKWPDQAEAMLKDAERLNAQDLEMRTRKSLPIPDLGSHAIEKAHSIIAEGRDPGRVFGTSESSSMVVGGDSSTYFNFEESRQRIQAMEPQEALNSLDETVEMIFQDEFGFGRSYLIPALADLYIILGHKRKAKNLLDRFLNWKKAHLFHRDYADFLEVYLKLIPEGCEEELSEIYSKMSINDHLKLNLKRFIGALSNSWHF